MTQAAPLPPLTLFLMTEKGYQFLRDTVARYQPLFSLVVVGADHAVQNDYEADIIALCAAHGVRCVRRADFTQVDTEYALAISWRWLIRHPADRLIVFHDSPLPKYRGFAPLVNALINGETEVGVSAIFGAREFDTGDILAQSTSTICYPITIAQAIAQVNQNYLACAEIVLQALRDSRALEATPQDEGAASYSVWRDDDDYTIDWQQPAAAIRRLIDAVGYPYKGAATRFDGKLLRILSAEERTDVLVENRHAGKVLFMEEGQPVVICGQGLLKITGAHLEEDGRVLPFFPLSKFRIRFA